MKFFLFATTLCALCISCSSNYDKHPNNNQMQSSNAVQPADWQITANVKQIIMTNSSLSSSARMISVTTNNGIVLLTGVVQNRKEGEKVLRMIQDVAGVRGIDNHLTLANP